MNTNRLRPRRVRLIQLFLSIFPWGCTLATLSCFLFTPVSLQAQQCTFRGNFTTTGPAGQFNNNTANPNCNAFALTWNTTGYTAISIQIEGSDNLSTWTAYSGTSTVVVGTNPSTALSGTIKISASSKIAYVRVNLVSATGTGAVNWQVFGYSGTSASVGAAGVVGPVGPTGPTGATGATGPTGPVGVASATAPLDLTASVLSIPAANLSTVDGSTKLVSWNGVAPTNGDCAFWLNGDLKDSGAGCGVLNPNFSSLVSGTNTIAAMLVGSGASLGSTGTGTVTATQVPTAAGATATTNGQVIYDTTNNNLHGAKNGADAVILQTTATTAGNGNCANWVNSGGSLKIGDAGAPCGSGSGGGGGVLTYSGPTLSILSGTAFCPVGGGGSCSATETNVDIDSSAVSTVSNMYVQLSQALGAGNSVAITWRKNASSQTVTCTISGASATSCNDTTHSFAVAQADLLDYQLVFAGTIVVTPTITTMSQFGTINAGVTSVFGNAGPTVGATGDIGATGKVLGVNGVPLCTGFTPTTGQNLQYTTASSPNPCYTAATGGGVSAFPLTFVQEGQYGSGSAVASFTVTFPQTTASSGNTAFMLVSADGNQTVTFPAGWAVDINQTQATFARFVLLHKATASDTSATFSTSTNASYSIYFFEVTGSHALDQSSAGGVANTQNLTFPAITPTANSVVFAMCGTTINTSGVTIPNPTSPINPMWRVLAAQPATANGVRALMGLVMTTPATNVSTKPPQMYMNQIPFFASSGMAYATFSIL